MLRCIKLDLLGSASEIVPHFGRYDLWDGWGSRADVNATNCAARGRTQVERFTNHSCTSFHAT